MVSVTVRPARSAASIAVGSSERMTKSARLPTSIVPQTPPSPRAAAPSAVAIRTTCQALSAPGPAILSIEAAGAQPLAHPTDVLQEMALRLRDDVASEPDQREANQRSAPAVDKGLFLVPKVIE